MANVGQDFEIWQGDTLTLDITVGGIADLTGMTLTWALADGPGRIPLVQKTSGAGEITFTDNVMHVQIDPADTVNLAPREYYHEAKVEDAIGSGGVVSIGIMFLRSASLKAV